MGLARRELLENAVGFGAVVGGGAVAWKHVRGDDEPVPDRRRTDEVATAEQSYQFSGFDMPNGGTIHYTLESDRGAVTSWVSAPEETEQGTTYQSNVGCRAVVEDGESQTVECELAAGEYVLVFEVGSEAGAAFAYQIDFYDDE